MTLLLLSLLGCEDGIVCTTIAVYSTTVTVVDDAGAPIDDAALVYTVDGGGEVPCEVMGGGQYACGIEQSGAFVITGSAEGYDEESMSVEVGADECHPIAETVTLTLGGPVCTAEVVASVQVNLADAGGAALEDPAVTFRVDGGAEAACSSSDGGGWLCGEDVTGNITVRGTATGHDPSEATVEVALDAAGCHAVTEGVDLELQWSAD